jgi:hypothetical protein
MPVLGQLLTADVSVCLVIPVSMRGKSKSCHYVAVDRACQCLVSYNLSVG